MLEARKIEKRKCNILSKLVLLTKEYTRNVWEADTIGKKLFENQDYAHF